MSGVLNDCDALLQGASVRILNPANAWINLGTSAPGFHLTSAGVADLAVVTVTADLVGLDDAVSFSVVGGTLSNANGKSVDVTYTGSTAIVTATVVSGGEEFRRSIVIPVLRDGSSGATAKIVRLEASEEVFKITKAGANSPASITLTASGQNLGSSPNFTIPVGSATLTAGANGSQKILTFANMASDSVTIQVTQDGVTDRVTITKLREGADGVDAITGVLSNELVALPANNAGAVSSYTGAACTLRIYKGITEDAGWAFSFAPASSAAALAYTTSGGTVTVTGMAAGVDAAFVDITATKSGTSVTKRFSVTKSKDGATGSGMPGARGAGHYYAAGNAWSDGVADAATPDGNVVGDVVTISSGTYVMEKRWTGSAWVDNGVVIDGKAIFPNSILASSIDARGLSIRDTAGNIILSAGVSLARQVSSNPNLCPTPIGFKTFENGATGNRNGDGRFGDGQYLVLPTSSDNRYVGANSPALGITWGAYHTVSFDAYCEGASRYLNVDIVNNIDWDSVGTGVWLSNTLTRYSFTEAAVGSANADKGFLRMFTTAAGGSAIIIANIKVELGTTVTPWCDSVISPQNANNKVLKDSITNTMIGGNLTSTNYNYRIDSAGTGWNLDRDGNLYVNQLHARGAVYGGAYSNGYAWPGGTGTGFHISASGALWGNPNTGKSFQIEGNGNVWAPNFSIVNGNAAFKGEVSGSLIRTSVLAAESARMLTTANRIAPFVVFDSGCSMNNSLGNKTVTLTDFCGPSYDGEGTYYPKRFASFRKDVFIKVIVHGDTAWESLFIDVEYHKNGSWGNITSTSADLYMGRGFAVITRYTPWAGGWDWIAFRARTSQYHTLSITLEVQFFNINESINGENTTSGINGSDNTYSPPPPPREDWCVDAETTKLSDGRYARDVKVNDLLACWNFEDENPGIEYAPVNTIRFGMADSVMLVTQSGVQIIQSKSTPMTVKEGRLVMTPDMLGEEVVVNRKGALAWEKVVSVIEMGEREVVKISLQDRMYFAGFDPDATIATHNIQYKN